MLVEHDALLAADQTLQAVETLWAPPMPAWASERFYGREALPLPAFLRGMAAVGSPGGRSFLDAGCGPGVKLHLARMLGFQYVAGFDLHPPYLKAAALLCPWPGCRLWEDDAFACQVYGQYDVVYSYRLCVDDADQRTLEELIVLRMKPGALAFFPQGVARDLGEPVATDVWRVA